jgi:hypothetical protein
VVLECAPTQTPTNIPCVFIVSPRRKTKSNDQTETRINVVVSDKNEVNGYRYYPNVQVVGLVNLKLTEKGNATSFPYGKVGNKFYITGTIAEKMPGATANSKSLSVMVMGDASPTAAEIKGSMTYVNNGKEITDDLNGRGNLSKSFWGDYIKTVSVHKVVTTEFPLTSSSWKTESESSNPSRLQTQRRLYICGSDVHGV